MLDLNRTLDSRHHAREQRQQAISLRADHAASILLDESSHQFVTIGGEGANGSEFVLAHETAIAFDISTENGNELALRSRGCRCGILSAPPNCRATHCL